jgi:hypothetical protein
MDQLSQYWTWLEYDRTALVVLATGIGIVLMLAVSIWLTALDPAQPQHRIAHHTCDLRRVLADFLISLILASGPNQRGLRS